MAKTHWALRGAALAGLLVLAGCNGGKENGGYGGPIFGFLEAPEPTLVTEIPNVTSAALGSDLPTNGQVAVVCDISKSALGKKVDARPEKGRAAYTLYDSNPGSSDQRAFYVTGFDDGCARKITAALAMFGSVELYEMMHFSGLVDVPGAATDATYGKVRRAACGSAKKPCTGNGLKTISRQTAFLQAYPRKGSSGHLEMLMHKGELAATAQK